MVFVFIEILFKMLLFKGGVLIYAEHCIWRFTSITMQNAMYIYVKLITILTTVYIITCFKLNAVNEIIVETFAFSLLYE